MLSMTFSPPPLNLMLTTDDIHIWYATLDVPLSQFEILSNTLSTDEFLRAERFHFEKDRKHFVVGRGILRSILGSYLGIKPGRMKFCYGENGKPALLDQTCRGMIRFNLSHSNGMTLYAFAIGREIGIDIEKVRDISEMEQIAESHFSVREYNVLCTLSESKIKEAFYNCWTRKEAFIKAIGDGLTMPLDSFDVSVVSGEPAKLLSIQGDQTKADHWSLQALTPSPGFIGALAVEGEYRHLACWQWNAE